jgi:hypothetical protein
MSVDVYIARGSEKNIHRSVVSGVERELVESVLGIPVPKESIDNFNCVRLWGVPRSDAERFWRNIKKGDVIVILPIKRSKKKFSECYVTIVVGKFPVNVTQSEIEKSEKLSRLVWEPYKKRQGIAESYPYIVFLNSAISIESIEDVLNILGKDIKVLLGYRESIQRIRKIPQKAAQELIQRIVKVPDTVTILTTLEEVYLETSAKLGWNIVNCYHYSTKYNTCYGAPIFLGNKDVWGSEGLFEELNKKLVEKGFKPITWEHLKQLIKSITKPGVVWASWYLSTYTNQVEPHDITIMMPLTQEPQ